MKFLVTATPGPMPPPPDLLREARDWLQSRVDDGTLECVYAFPHGGGCVIGEYDSHEDLMEQLMDYPLSPFVSYESHALVEFDAAFDRFIPYVERVGERMASTSS